KEDDMRFRLAPRAPLWTGLLGTAVLALVASPAWSQSLFCGRSRPACCPTPICPSLPGLEQPIIPETPWKTEPTPTPPPPPPLPPPTSTRPPGATPQPAPEL